MLSRTFALVVAGLVIPTAHVAAQVPLFVAAAGGLAIDVDNDDPTSGAGFAWQGQLGLRFPSVSFGGEYSHQDLGHDRKAKSYGAFVRIRAGALRHVRPYLVAGLADYRFSPTGPGSTSTIGGSLGPGARFLIGDHASVILEGRFHSTFDRLRAVATQQWVAAMVGVDLSL